jgi:hypothetical protein
MYLVRTIPKDEHNVWVNQLGQVPTCLLPLPFVPQKDFDKVIILHGLRALCFDLDRVELLSAAKRVKVGQAGKTTVNAKVFVYVKQGKPRKGVTKIQGFMGVRYVAKASEVANF